MSLFRARGLLWRAINYSQEAKLMLHTPNHELYAPLHEVDPEIHELIELERRRQFVGLELIASEV